MSSLAESQASRNKSVSAILSCVIGVHWLAVGDAASSYDSMTSAGITKALQQGLDASRAVTNQGDAELQQYQSTIFSESGFWQTRRW